MIAVKKPSARETAVACGVSLNTLRDWWARGAPRDGSPEVLKAWRDEHIPARLGGPGSRQIDGDDLGSLAERRVRAEIDKFEEDARSKRLKNDLLEGQLVYRDAVLTDVSELVLMIRHRLEALPDVIVSEFPKEFQAKADELISNQIHLALTEMSSWKSSAANPNGEDDDEDDDFSSVD